MGAETARSLAIYGLNLSAEGAALTTSENR
jgi:hypothetical protein